MVIKFKIDILSVNNNNNNVSFFSIECYYILVHFYEVKILSRGADNHGGIVEKLSLTRFERVENQLFRCFNRRKRAFMMLAINERCVKAKAWAELGVIEFEDI